MAWEEIKLVYKPKGVQFLKPCGTLPSNKNPESFRITCLQLGHTQKLYSSSHFSGFSVTRQLSSIWIHCPSIIVHNPYFP